MYIIIILYITNSIQLKKQTILGFIKSRMDRINKMQEEGYYLQSIYEDIKSEYPEDFPFETFKVSLYRIRNNNSRNKSSQKENVPQKNKFDWSATHQANEDDIKF